MLLEPEYVVCNYRLTGSDRPEAVDQPRSCLGGLGAADLYQLAGDGGGSEKLAHRILPGEGRAHRSQRIQRQGSRGAGGNDKPGVGTVEVALRGFGAFRDLGQIV